ncbi:hypothetical protein Tco_0801637 [Tanacetum coccineum]|uniref:Uncharacterized protein n=1 Tax=Tanacetum coccineum TaxID=301880 RepID=A0ABQ4ZWI2_9ASTR
MGDAKKTTTLKTDVYKKAHSALLLCLNNKVLREVNKEDFAIGVCIVYSQFTGVEEEDTQEKESLAHVWHKFLGYTSEARLHELERREVLRNKGLGSFSMESMSGCWYFLSIVGDYSRRVWVHLLRHKNEAFNTFKEWKQLVETRQVFTDSVWLPDSFMVRTSDELRDVDDIWLDDVKTKIIISSDVMFNESLMYKDTLKGVGVADSGKEVEFVVELQGSRVEPTVNPHTGENPGNEDEEQDDEEPQQQYLDNYVLVRDRAKRTTTIRVRYRHERNASFSRPSRLRKEDDMAAYAFTIAEEEDTRKPITF